MNWRNILTKNRGTWLWFYLTFVASLLPVIIRFSVWLDNNITPFDIKDLLFAGLAMNLSNLNLVGSKDLDERTSIILTSCVLIVIISTRLSALLSAGDNYSLADHVGSNCFTLCLVGGSIFLSHSANKYIFETVN